MRKKRTKYSESFKAEAIAKIKDNHGYSSKIAKELDIPYRKRIFLNNMKTKHYI